MIGSAALRTPKKKRIDKLKLNAELGIPRFWRYMSQNGLAGFALTEAARLSHVSRVIAGLPLLEIEKRMDLDIELITVLYEWRQRLKRIAAARVRITIPQF